MIENIAVEKNTKTFFTYLRGQSMCPLLGDSLTQANPSVALPATCQDPTIAPPFSGCIQLGLFS